MPIFNPLFKVSEFRLKLYPQNYKECLRFYRDVLYFPIIQQWDRKDSKGVMFDTGAAIIELLWDGSSVKAKGVDISVQVKDVWTLASKLKGKVKVIHPLRDNAWGDTSYAIQDPAGFEITFFTNH